MEQRSDFKDLTFSFPDYSLQLGKYIVPIKIKIENIKLPKGNPLDIKYKEDDNLGFEFLRFKELQLAQEHLCHINITDKLYSNFSQNFLQYHNLIQIEEILSYLDTIDIYTLNKSVSERIPIMVTAFRDRLYNSLKLDIEPPHIDYKGGNDKPKNIKDYLEYPMSYIFLQGLFEYSPQPLFYENVNKTPDEWSLREFETRMAYITAKSRFDNTENLWQLKSMDIERKKK